MGSRTRLNLSVSQLAIGVVLSHGLHSVGLWWKTPGTEVRTLHPDINRAIGWNFHEYFRTLTPEGHFGGVNYKNSSH